MSQGVNKIAAERSMRTLLDLVSQPGNDVCADCKTRNPRWASYNLGIFICVSCASIHRKMGTHISKVKSLTLDSWTKEQVETMKSIGNIKSNAHYNPDEVKHPPPTNMIESERDSELEKYIRAKYQYKSFIPRAPPGAASLGSQNSISSKPSPVPNPPRSQTVPAPSPSTAPPPTTVTAPSAPPAAPAPESNLIRTQSQFRSVSQPVPPSLSSSSQPPSQQQQQAQPQLASNPVWNDLAQLQAPAVNSSLPLQYASPTSTQPIGIPSAPTGLAVPNAYSGLSVSPNAPYPSPLSSQGGMFSGGQQRSMSLNTGLSIGVGGMAFAPGTSPGMMGTSPMGTSPSPSLLQPQPTFGGSGFAGPSMPMQNATPSPNPFPQQTLSPSGMGMGMGMGMQQQQPGQFAPSSYGQSNQQFLQPGQSQMQMQMQPRGSPMFSAQQPPFAQGPPMFQSQPLGQGMPTGGPYMQVQQQQQPYGSQQPFMSAPYGQPGMQQQQQPMYGQGSAFGGTGWQQQQQQQWGGM